MAPSERDPEPIFDAPWCDARAEYTSPVVGLSRLNCEFLKTVPANLQALESLAQQARLCQSCSLAERRRNVVFGEGDPAAPLVLIGEGPGDQEDATGRPFVGRAGQLLDQALADCGLSRQDIYIANTVKCRACDWSTGKPVNRAPNEDEVQACRQWLWPQLKLIRPQVILCIGAPSAKNLIKKNFKITQERGRFFRSEHARAILATLHPAYILRQRNISGDGGYSLLVADLQKAWETALELHRRRAPSSSPIQPAIDFGEGG